MKLDMLSTYVEGGLEIDNHYINSNHQHNHHQNSTSYSNTFMSSNQSNASNNLGYGSFDSLGNQQQQHASGDTGSPTGDTKLFKAFNYDQQQQQRNNSSEAANNLNGNTNQEVSLECFVYLFLTKKF